MHSRILMLATLITSIAFSDIWALAGTSGTPLGGIGSGYVKYDATSGNIAAGSRLPPAAGEMVSEFPSKMSSRGGFHFFAGGESVEKAKTNNEDAKCPLYTADFGEINDVNFSLNAFGPVIPGEGDLNIKLATSPAALFEISATNKGSSAIDVAVAFQFMNKSNNISGLLGGADDAVIDQESQFKGISYPDAEFNDLSKNNSAVNTGNAYMLVNCSKDGATYSAGAMGDFLTTGILSKSNGNSTAAKCNIAPGETVTFKFVLSWWRTFVSAQDRYGAGKNDDDNFFYHNYYQNSKEAAVFCMEHFDYVRNGIVSMVNRVMGSNFPDWYKDRLLNNTYPLIHNSLWTKDGRAAYWEGKYGIIGTIDQGQHAAIWYVHNWPKNQWAELAYWLRDARQEPNLKGQIHHDFNTSPGLSFSPPESRFMTPWDHWNRDDYWFQPNTTEWSDLNSMAIFKAYELMLVTGNRDSLSMYFPKVIVTADRLFQMSQEANSYIPIESKSTYDSDGIKTPQYACGVAVAAYKAMAEMAKFLGDDETKNKYQEIYENARAEYKEKLFDDQFGNITTRGWAEGHVGGYSWANYFGLPPIMDQDFIETACDRIYDLYIVHSDLKKRIGGWHFYTYDHFGGALTVIGRPDKAMEFHKWDHEVNYINLPDQVFWQELFSDEIGPGKYASYMTGPNIWRSYFQFMGYLLDKANDRLWIRPNIPSEMENKISNAALPNPYGWGTLNYDESDNLGHEKQTQEIFIRYDNPTSVKEIVLKNNTGSNTPFVILTSTTHGGRIEGLTTEAQDWEVEQNIRVTLSDPVTIDNKGLRIRVYSEEVGTIKGPDRTPRSALKIASTSLSAGKPIICTIDKPGNVTIELLSLNGKKIGTLVNRTISTTGKHSLFWNGKTIDGKLIGNTAGILRLSSPGGSVSRLIFNMKN